MFCPVCHAEFRVGFDMCSDCHVGLVSALPTEADRQIDWREPVTVFRGSDVREHSKAATKEHLKTGHSGSGLSIGHVQ